VLHKVDLVDEMAPWKIGSGRIHPEVPIVRAVQRRRRPAAPVRRDAAVAPASRTSTQHLHDAFESHVIDAGADVEARIRAEGALRAKGFVENRRRAPRGPGGRAPRRDRAVVGPGARGAPEQGRDHPAGYQHGFPLKERS
jgi:hypothetical protein